MVSQAAISAYNATVSSESASKIANLHTVTASFAVTAAEAAKEALDKLLISANAPDIATAKQAATEAETAAVKAEQANVDAKAEAAKASTTTAGSR